MLDFELRRAPDDFEDAFTGETGFGTAWALLWVIMDAERHAMALALISDEQSDVVAGEVLQEWAEPQMVLFKRNKAIPMIAWGRVVSILRNQLPAPANEG